MEGERSNEPEYQEIECGFQWDENSQLYYHASTGFYHDPVAGWYYNSRDGLYYKFENGNYVLLESNQEGKQSEMLKNASEEENSEAETDEREFSTGPPQDKTIESQACSSSDQSEYPPPPSEWLEETLIDMFLSGYSNQTTNAAASDMTIQAETNGEEMLNGGTGYDDDQELEEGEWVPDDPNYLNNLNEKILGEGISQEEENWRAQYGEVSKFDEEWMSDLQLVDLWDWSLVRGTKKDGKTEVARLVGRLKKRSSRLHPAVSSGGGVLKTAPVCEVHLDMVRVTSGRIYRLRIPSLQYLASLPVYDASNPTKDWGFPQLSANNYTKKSPACDKLSDPHNLEPGDALEDKSPSAVKIQSLKKDNVYRDRAAERRALHGGFGIGPGQKKPRPSDYSPPSSPTSLHPEDAAAESLTISFGTGSYARKVMEGMGWKEGEALGASVKGLTEPLQAVGNKGNAGLGWKDGRRN